MTNETASNLDAPWRSFGDDPWKIVVTEIDQSRVAEDETIFALANGYLGLRGNYEEGLPLSSHGTFINGLHETWKIRHAENAYGFAEHGQTIANVPDLQTIRVYVDDERLNLETSDILEFRRELDLRAGTLNRSLLWLTPTGKRVRVDSRRMVSFTSRHMATIEFQVTMLDAAAEVTIASLLINRQDLGRITPDTAEDSLADPRKSETLEGRIFDAGPTLHETGRSVVSYRVHNSGMTVGIGMDHVVECGGAQWEPRVESSDDRIRYVFHGHVESGQTLNVLKTGAYHSSATAGMSELLDRCVHTLAHTAEEPVENRWEQQRSFLDTFWEYSDVEIDGSREVQQSVRWNLFQLAQAAARADGRGIPAKGLTGSGYSGHYFWDAEIYVLPFLTYTTPLWARNALRSRQHMLPNARRRAKTLNEQGASFPWRTISGEEASAYYAAGTAAYHINADITYAPARYVTATGDVEFMVSGAGDMAIETARLWRSLGFWSTDPDGVERFHIHGVTGPDEYTTVVNDNLFTNVMARYNLGFAAEVVRRVSAESPALAEELRDRLQLEPDEVDQWEWAAQGMSVPYSETLGVHPQDAHFLEREVWDLANTPPEQKPLLLHFHPLVIYRFQVLKQADVVLALLLASDEFGREEKRRDFEYYDALTTGDSTLSAVVQSIIAAEVGYRDLAQRYFDHALRVDLDNLHQNSGDGVHIASAGGVWMMLVQGFAGMRDTSRKLTFDPRLPDSFGGLKFSLRWRQSRIRVHLERDRISFQLIEGNQPVTVDVRGTAVVVGADHVEVVELEDQGPDLGEFRGLSAAILPREPERKPPVPTLLDIPVTSPPELLDYREE